MYLTTWQIMKLYIETALGAKWWDDVVRGGMARNWRHIGLS